MDGVISVVQTIVPPNWGNVLAGVTSYSMREIGQPRSVAVVCKVS